MLTPFLLLLFLDVIVFCLYRKEFTHGRYLACYLKFIMDNIILILIFEVFFLKSAYFVADR